MRGIQIYAIAIFRPKYSVCAPGYRVRSKQQTKGLWFRYEDGSIAMFYQRRLANKECKRLNRLALVDGVPQEFEVRKAWAEVME